MNIKTICLLLTGILSVMPLQSKASCAIAASFKESYAYYSHQGNVIFIKGVALDVVEYGRHIKVIEDLKGNFTGDSTILVWGAGSFSIGVCMSNEKLDHLALYQENDTLIMLVKPVTFENCLEVFGGFTTFDCSISVLKLSNGNVTGRIARTWEETTMPWDEFQQFLANDGFVNAFEAHRAEWSYLYACGSAPYTLYKTILYGDTVIDGVNWKIVSGLFIENQLLGGGKGLVRTEEGKKVIFRGYPGDYYSEEEIILYDFSQNVGDSMLVFYPSFRREILEIDSIALDYGKKHKRMKIYGSFDAIEGVGYTSHPFYPFIGLPTCASGPFLVCCEVNRGLVYKNPLYADCNGTLVNNETVGNITQKARITFFDGRLRVTLDDETPFDVGLYNLRGMLIAQVKNNRNEMFANWEYLPKGVYIVRVSSGNFSYSEKIVR